MTRHAAELVLAIAAACCAGAALGKSSDRQQTMQVEANKSDCTVTDSGPCVLTGNVHIASPGQTVSKLVCVAEARDAASAERDRAIRELDMAKDSAMKELAERSANLAGQNLSQPGG